MNCLNCNNETNNPKFCSRSCAATYNNKMYPKRHLTNTCKNCGTKISRDRTYCRPCFGKERMNDWSTYTIGDLRSRYNYQKNTRIRSLARNWYRRSDKPKQCACGYDKHYEVCHIKSVNSFEDHELVTTVNSLNNLIALCPNCHWEFDNLASPGGVEPLDFHPTV